jgi:hypothetical protein
MGDVADDDAEPPVPPGLSALTAAQAAMVDFFRIDEDLVGAAAEASEVETDDTEGKRPRTPLCFTKTGDQRLEKVYARHFVWPGKGPFHPPRPKESPPYTGS